jgi:hypothetical protein
MQLSAPRFTVSYGRRCARAFWHRSRPIVPPSSLFAVTDVVQWHHVRRAHRFYDYRYTQVCRDAPEQTFQHRAGARPNPAKCVRIRHLPEQGDFGLSLNITGHIRSGRSQTAAPEHPYKSEILIPVTCSSPHAGGE